MQHWLMTCMLIQHLHASEAAERASVLHMM
jgi:hypothetical protein